MKFKVRLFGKFDRVGEQEIPLMDPKTGRDLSVIDIGSMPKDIPVRFQMKLLFGIKATIVGRINVSQV